MFSFRDKGSEEESPLPVSVNSYLAEKVLVLIGEVILGASLAAERLTVRNLLQVVQPASDALVAVRVECVEVDACASVNAGVDLRMFDDRIAGGIHDTGSCGRVRIDEVAVLVRSIVRTFHVSVTERVLDRRECGHGLAAPLEFALPLIVCRLNGVLHFRDRLGVALRDDERHAELRRTAVDGLCLPDVGIAPSCLDTRDHFCRIDNFCHDVFSSTFFKIFCCGIHRRPLVAHGSEGWFPLRFYDEASEQFLKLIFSEQTGHCRNPEQFLLIWLIARFFDCFGDRRLVGVFPIGATLDQLPACPLLALDCPLQGVLLDVADPCGERVRFCKHRFHLGVFQCWRHLKVIPRKFQIVLCPLAARCLDLAELTVRPRTKRALSCVCQLCRRYKRVLRPCQKVSFRDAELRDVGETRLEDHHPHTVDVVQTVEHLDAPECVAHHLRIVLGTDLDAFAVFVVHNADGLAGDDESVGCTEAIRHERREIDALLHRHHRILRLLAELRHKPHNELCIEFCTLFHLTVIGRQLLGRIAHPLTKCLTEFVLTERMRVCPLSGVLAWRIGLLRIEPRRWRTSNPSCGRGCGEDGVFTCQCAQPPSGVPHNVPAQAR
nr:MAG TPA: hypothetical protein [Caudoviricetes sp.]